MHAGRALAVIIVTLAAPAAGLAGSATGLLTVFIPEAGAPITLARQVSSADDQAAELEFSNPTGRDVAAIKIAWITLAPAACSESALPPKVEPPHAYSLSIPAGTMATLRNIGLSPESLRAWARPAGAHLVETQVALTEVDFTDGGVWRSLRNPSAPFSQSDLASVAGFCRDGRLSPERPSSAASRRGRQTPGATAASPSIVGCFFYCVPWSYLQNCVAAGGSCTNIPCSSKAQCTYQTCYLECD
jgi:hypothetical protein